MNLALTLEIARKVGTFDSKETLILSPAPWLILWVIRCVCVLKEEAQGKAASSLFPVWTDRPLSSMGEKPKMSSQLCPLVFLVWILLFEGLRCW